MGKVMLRFDYNSDQTVLNPCTLTLKATTENTVKLPTNSNGRGLISKQELVPGVNLAVINYEKPWILYD
jgi:hypothetical protein